MSAINISLCCCWSFWSWLASCAAIDGSLIALHLLDTWCYNDKLTPSWNNTILSGIVSNPDGLIKTGLMMSLTPLMSLESLLSLFPVVKALWWKHHQPFCWIWADPLTVRYGSRNRRPFDATYKTTTSCSSWTNCCRKTCFACLVSVSLKWSQFLDDKAHLDHQHSTQMNTAHFLG